MTMRRQIEDQLAASAFVKLQLLQRESAAIEAIAKRLVKTLKAGKKILLFGNGGSAADAQHIAAELEGRFMRERKALPALALTTNTSTLSAVANDYGYARVFARQVEAHARKGDAVIGISTSGNSPNVLEGIKAAKKAGAATIGFTNAKGGKLKRAADLCLCVPSTDTQRVQECHLSVGHILCGFLDAVRPR